MQSNKDGLKYFDKLSTNLIGYIFRFFTSKEMIALSSLNKRFLKALSSDFIWENLAKNNILFLPEETSSFKTWASYYKFLSLLSNSLETGKLKKKHTVNTYRGHKAIIHKILSIPYSDIPSAFTLSADTSGSICVWNLEKDEDGDDYYKNYEILNTQNKIGGLIYIHNKLVIWDEKNTFYIYEVNTIFKTNIIHKDRFNLLYKFDTNIDNNINHIYMDINNSLIYMSDFDAKNFPIIYCYNFKTGNKEKTYITNNSNNLNTLKNIENIDIINNFLIFNDTIILTNPYGNYNTTNNNNNLYIFNKKDEILINKYTTNIQIINNIFINKRTNEIILSGINNNHPTFLIYNILSTKYMTNLELKNTIIINKEIDINKNNCLNMSFKDENNSKVICLLNSNELINVDLCSKIISETINLKFREEILKNKLNVQYMDNFRIIFAYGNNHLAIYSSQTGEFWFYLYGGATNNLPKSFIKHPNYTGAHLIVPTRYSIIGGIGNIIREYKFTPDINN